MTTSGTTGRRERGLTALAFVAALVLLAGWPARARAATACGTLITNAATITMTSGFPDFVAYSVSYNMSVMAVVLCPPVVKLMKLSSGPAGAAGDTITFSVCAENQVSDTIWGVTITEALPSNMAFVAMDVADYDMTAPSLGAVVSTNASVTAGPWNAGGPAAGQVAPWCLRWVVPGVGPVKSACVTYSARIL